MEKMITAKANWLAAHGHQVTIITTEQAGKPNFFKLDPSVSTVDLGIGYTYIPAQSVISTALTFMSKKRLHRKRLSQFLLSHPQDIVISTFGNEVEILPRIKDGSRKITEIHFDKNYRLKENKGLAGRINGRLRTLRSPAIARKYDMLVTLTRQDMGQWKGVDNITAIPNFVPVTATVSPLTAKRAIAVGRLTHQKGFDMLIDMWTKVAKARPDWTLDIYGNGELRDILQQRIDSLGLQHCVKLRGGTSDIASQFLSSSLFIMTSRWEGLPLVLTEAMSYGLISLSFDCECGPRELISDGESGYLIKPDDIDSMADKVIEVASDIDKYKGTGLRAHQTISQKFSPDAVMRQWTALFDQILS